MSTSERCPRPVAAIPGGGAGAVLLATCPRARQAEGRGTGCSIAGAEVQSRLLRLPVGPPVRPVVVEVMPPVLRGCVRARPRAERGGRRPNFNSESRLTPTGGRPAGGTAPDRPPKGNPRRPSGAWRAGGSEVLRPRPGATPGEPGGLPADVAELAAALGDSSSAADVEAGGGARLLEFFREDAGGVRAGRRAIPRVVRGAGSGFRDVSPLHVAAYIRTRPGSVPTVKQHLAAIRMLGGWLVVRQVLPGEPRGRGAGAEARRHQRGRRPSSRRRRRGRFLRRSTRVPWPGSATGRCSR